MSVERSIEHSIAASGTEQSETFKPFGARSERNIYLVECSPINFMIRYFHEVGHILGDDLCFALGDVLYPSQALYTIAHLGPGKADQLLAQLTLPGDHIVDDFIIDAANTIINAFALNKFNPSTIQLHYPVPEEDIIHMLKNARGGAGVKVDEAGNLKGESTRYGRNIELSAMAVQLGCTKILENTLSRVHPSGNIRIDGQKSTQVDSHSRAYNIVKRAYDPSRSLIIPSVRDLYRKS